MLESDVYILDKKEEAERLLADLRSVFGDKLYDTIYSVLRTQHEQKTAQIKSKAPPVLYHGSTTKIDTFEPRLNTCQFGLHTGKMVFASESLEKNAIYSFREPRRSDGHKATSIITLPMQTPHGERRLVFQSKLKNNGYMYKLPSETFIPVVRLDGHFNNEWISFSAVKPVEVEAKTLKEVEDQYKLLCFTFPGVKQEEEFLKNIKKFKKNLEKRGYKAVEEMVKKGLVTPITTQQPHLKELLNDLQDKTPSTIRRNDGVEI